MAADHGLPSVTWAKLANSYSIDRVNQDEVDIALDPFSINLDNMTELESIHLFDDPALLLTHENDHLSARSSIGAEELRGLRLLTLLHGTGAIYGWVPHDICNALGFSPKLESVSGESVEELFAERLNPGHYALIPASTQRQLEPLLPYARFIPVENTSFDMRAYYKKDPSNEGVSHVVQALAGLAKEIDARPIR